MLVAGGEPKTVRKYTAKAIEAGLAFGGPPLSEGSWSALVAEWFPEIADRGLRQVTWPEIEAHRERIKGWLGVVTVSTIHQRLRDDHGLGVSESSLRRFIWANFDEEVARDGRGKPRGRYAHDPKPNDDRGPAGGTLNGTRPGSARSARWKARVPRRTHPVDGHGDGGQAVQGVRYLRRLRPELPTPWRMAGVEPRVVEGSRAQSGPVAPTG